MIFDDVDEILTINLIDSIDDSICVGVFDFKQFYVECWYLYRVFAWS